MAAEENAATKVDHPAETVESLTREIEQLKARLEEERKKINDVSGERDPPPAAAARAEHFAVSAVFFQF